MGRLIAAALTVCTLGAAACSRAEPPRRYPLRGQVLAVHPDKQQLTVRHEDIPGFMPGMTMSFEVGRPQLMQDRQPGELISATLEVVDYTGRLVEIQRTGTAPLPDNANEVALATELLAPGDPVPDTAFIDQDDRRRSLAEWRGSHTLVTFIYTRCPLPTVCPLMDQNFATIQRAVAEDAALRGRVTLISVSFDPDHDTPEVLRAHAARRKADLSVWTFLTGDRATIDRFAGRFGVGVIRPSDTAGEITHNLRTAHLDPDLRVVKLYSGSEWTPGAVLADLRAAIQRP
jgi:protein SCO1/2